MYLKEISLDPRLLSEDIENNIVNNWKQDKYPKKGLAK